MSNPALTPQQILAQVTNATEALKSYISLADKVIDSLANGSNSEVIKNLCEQLLQAAQSASASNQAIERFLVIKAPQITALSAQRTSLIALAQEKNQLLGSILNSLVQQTGSQMNALKTAMNSVADTYTAKGKPLSSLANRTLSKA